MIAMNKTDVLQEIQDLNMSYLLLAQRLLSEDRATARLRFRFSDEMADLVLSLSSRQLSRLSRVNQLLFSLGFEVEHLKKLVQDEREPGLGQTHTSILLSR